MTVLRVTVPDQYFCTKHPDLNITAREKKSRVGTGVPAYGEIFTSDIKSSYIIVLLFYFSCIQSFLATLVALHFTPVSESVGHSFELA